MRRRTAGPGGNPGHRRTPERHSAPPPHRSVVPGTRRLHCSRAGTSRTDRRDHGGNRRASHSRSGMCRRHSVRLRHSLHPTGSPARRPGCRPPCGHCTRSRVRSCMMGGGHTTLRGTARQERRSSDSARHCLTRRLDDSGSGRCHPPNGGCWRRACPEGSRRTTRLAKAPTPRYRRRLATRDRGANPVRSVNTMQPPTTERETTHSDSRNAPCPCMTAHVLLVRSTDALCVAFPHHGIRYVPVAARQGLFGPGRHATKRPSSVTASAMARRAATRSVVGRKLNLSRTANRRLSFSPAARLGSTSCARCSTFA